MKLEVLILCFLSIFWLSSAGVDITNVKCTAVDRKFSDFEYCFIKAINRTYKYVSLKVKLFKVPVNNVTVRFTLMRKSNTYKPYLYDNMFDACKFLRERRNPMVAFAYGFIEHFSNMNHTCPFDHDLLLEKLDFEFINRRFMNWLPVPEGEYAVFTTWYAYNKIRALVKLFGRHT